MLTSDYDIEYDWFTITLTGVTCYLAEQGIHALNITDISIYANEHSPEFLYEALPLRITYPYAQIADGLDFEEKSRKIYILLLNIPIKFKSPIQHYVFDLVLEDLKKTADSADQRCA